MQRRPSVSYSRTDKLAGRDCPFNTQGSVIAKIPISEGCASNCSFCATKLARGPLNSFSEKLILRVIEMSVANGAREIDLTSQDVGSYGLDKRTDIAELAMKASQIPGDFRIRIGMLNPEHLHRYFDSLLDAYRSEKVYKFIHLPMQSGSNVVLKDMDRKYTVEEVGGYIKELRRRVKGIGIWTDLIVGYPTETKDDFKESVGWLERTRPLVTNVSKFSVRSCTKASILKQIKSEEIKRRSLEMASLARQIQEKDMNLLLGKKETVLITGRNARSFEGRDACYRAIAVSGRDLEVGSFVNAKITGSCFAYLSAKASST